MTEANTQTIQYLTNRITTLQDEKQRLTKTVEKFHEIIEGFNAIWTMVFPNEKEEEKSNSQSPFELPSYMNIETLKREFESRMQELCQLRQLCLKLSNQESELLLKLSDCQNGLKQYKLKNATLSRELKTVRLNTRRSMIDPLLNYNFDSIYKENYQLSKQLQSANEQLLIKEFSVKSVPGQHLMNKCKKLLIENHEIGKQLNNSKNERIREEMQLVKIHNANLTNHLLDSQMQIRSLHQEIQTLKLQNRNLVHKPLSPSSSSRKDKHRTDRSNHKSTEKNQNRDKDKVDTNINANANTNDNDIENDIDIDIDIDTRQTSHSDDSCE